MLAFLIVCPNFLIVFFPLAKVRNPTAARCARFPRPTCATWRRTCAPILVRSPTSVGCAPSAATTAATFRVTAADTTNIALHVPAGSLPSSSTSIHQKNHPLCLRFSLMPWMTLPLTRQQMRNRTLPMVFDPNRLYGQKTKPNRTPTGLPSERSSSTLRPRASSWVQGRPQQPCPMPLLGRCTSARTAWRTSQITWCTQCIWVATVMNSPSSAMSAVNTAATSTHSHVTSHEVCIASDPANIQKVRWLIYSATE